jgi:hypothetical protein
MSIYFVAPLLGIFGALTCFLWSSIVDGTLKHEPSEWLAWGYLAVFATLLVFAAPYLGQIQTHPYRTVAAFLTFMSLMVWLAVILWRKAPKWDNDYRRKHQ